VQIAKIDGAFLEGGFTGNTGRTDIAGVVHGQEFVIPAHRVDEFGAGFFESIRQGDIAPEDLDGRNRGNRGGSAPTVTANFASINSRQEMRDFMAQEGWKIVWDQQRKRQRAV
jgi:hypothetical protein